MGVKAQFTERVREGVDLDNARWYFNTSSLNSRLQPQEDTRPQLVQTISSSFQVLAASVNLTMKPLWILPSLRL